MALKAPLALISELSRRKKSRCRFWPRLRSSDGVGNAQKRNESKEWLTLPQFMANRKVFYPPRDASKWSENLRAHTNALSRDCRELLENPRAKAEVHCHLYHPVRIEIRLREESPENGNISENGRILFAFSRKGCRFPECGDP